MPDRREPRDQGSAITNGSTLIARREALRPDSGRLGGGNGAPVGAAACDADVAAWLDDTDVTASTILRMERVRQRHWNTFRRLMAIATDYTPRRILQALVEYRHGVGYDTLTEYADASKRTVRRKVKELSELGVVERLGNPATIAFVSDDHYLLAVDATTIAPE